MLKKLGLTEKEHKELTHFVKEHEEIVKKLAHSLETNMKEISKKHPDGVLIKPSETDIATMASIASRLKGGGGVAEVDTMEVVFVGACVFTA
jgi:ABC-type branched-subunit amino acid transport system substrate-binding protein